MPTTDLRLDEPGTLPRPGPVGRIARLLLACICLGYVWNLVHAAGNLVDSDGHIRSLVWNGLVPGLLLVSYVINIGYSRAWKKWPAIASAVIFVVLGVISFLTTRSPESILLATSVWTWEIYVFAHLGLAFAVAGFIGTPGCEMRAFHDLYSRVSGRPTKEHHCPIGPLGPIDRWEASGRNT